MGADKKDTPEGETNQSNLQCNGCGCGGCDQDDDEEELKPVKFVDDHENPRGTGRIDLSTGERHY